VVLVDFGGQRGAGCLLAGRNMFDYVLRVLRKEDQGLDLTEYALLVAMVVIAALESLGINITAVFSNAAADISRDTGVHLHHVHTP
jgi:Flp pilus assembly pilin Flp